MNNDEALDIQSKTQRLWDRIERLCKDRTLVDQVKLMEIYHISQLGKSVFFNDYLMEHIEE